MLMKRRDFCKSALSVPLILGARCTSDKDMATEGYYYYGKDKDYKDFKIIDEGRKIVKIETFTRPKVGVVRIQTDDGSVGYGQLSPHDAIFSTLILHEKLADNFLGEDPAHIDALVDDAIESNYKFPWTYVCRALAGLDTAIWDLYGKIKQKPVVELVGGSVKPIMVYGSSMRRDITPEDEASRMVALRDSMGFKAFKLRVAKVTGHDEDQWPGRSEKLVQTVRKALGDNTDLMVDANSGYSPPRAIELGEILEDNNVFFFEEPCPYWELEWTREVTQKLNVLVAGGEQDNEMAQWQRMLEMHAVDIAQPDVGYIGGFTRAYRVARMAQKHNMLVVPHTSNVSMVSIISLHLLGAFPNHKYLEYTIDGTSELANESRAMYVPQMNVVDGQVMVPDGPGWGVEFNQKWLESAIYRKSE